MIMRLFSLDLQFNSSNNKIKTIFDNFKFRPQQGQGFPSSRYILFHFHATWKNWALKNVKFCMKPDFKLFKNV